MSKNKNISRRNQVAAATTQNNEAAQIENVGAATTETAPAEAAAEPKAKKAKKERKPTIAGVMDQEIQKLGKSAEVFERVVAKMAELGLTGKVKIGTLTAHFAYRAKREDWAKLIVLEGGEFKPFAAQQEQKAA